MYLAARSEEKASAAIKRLEAETKRKAIFLRLDLADLPSVRRAAEKFLALESRLDILFNNACVSRPRPLVSIESQDLQRGSKPPSRHAHRAKP